MEEEIKKNKYLKYKTKYLSLKSETSSKEKLIELDDKKYNSAGVLLLTKENNIDYVVFLQSTYPISDGKNKGRLYCDIPGGGIDEKDISVEEAASRELFEESKMLIKISPTELSKAKNNNSYLELQGRRLSGRRKAGLFACYVCNVSTIDKNIYFLNKSILEKVKLPHYYYETSNVIKFPLNEVKERLKDVKFETIISQFSFLTSDNEEMLLTNLATKCLWLFVNNNIKPIELTNYIVKDNSLKFKGIIGKTIHYE